MPNRPGSLRHNTLWMMGAQGSRLVLEAGYFILVARSLGVEQYGLFAGVRAVVSVVAPFAGVGSGHQLVRDVSRDRSMFNVAWGNAAVTTVVSGIALLAVSVAAVMLLFPGRSTLLLVALIGIADLLMRKMLELAAQAFQAVEVLRTTAQLGFALGFARLAAAVALITLVPQPSAVAWAALYLLSLAVVAGAGAALVLSRFGMPTTELARIPGGLVDGLYFSVGTAATMANNDVDKALLARLSSLSAAGLYSAAYRVVEVALVPVRSLFQAAYARFFQHGAAGVGGSLAFAGRMLPVAALYGVGAGVGLFVLAPAVPHVLGAEYVEAVNVVRWLSPLPLLKLLNSFPAAVLTGAGYQGRRGALQVVAAVVNVALNLWLIPAFSWRGAAWASLASEALLVLCLWAAVTHGRHAPPTKLGAVG